MRWFFSGLWNPLPKDAAVNKSLSKKPKAPKPATPTVKPFKPAQPATLQPFEPKAVGKDG